MAASIVAEVAGAQVERQLTVVLTAPDKCALGVVLVDFIESVLERRLRALAVSGVALEDLRAHLVDHATQILPAATEPTSQGQADDASRKWQTHLLTFELR